jgi:hypothetical protein
MEIASQEDINVACQWWNWNLYLTLIWHGLQMNYTPTTDTELCFLNSAILSPMPWSGLSAAQPVNIIVVIIVLLISKLSYCVVP